MMVYMTMGIIIKVTQVHRHDDGFETVRSEAYIWRDIGRDVIRCTQVGIGAGSKRELQDRRRDLRAGLDVGVVASGRGRTELLIPALGLSLGPILGLGVNFSLGLACFCGTRLVGRRVWFSLSGFVFLWKGI